MSIEHFDVAEKETDSKRAKTTLRADKILLVIIKRLERLRMKKGNYSPPIQTGRNGRATYSKTEKPGREVGKDERNQFQPSES